MENFKFRAHMDDGNFNIDANQPQILQQLLESAQSFTKDHNGNELLMGDMIKYLGDMAYDRKIFEAILGAYAIGFEQGYQKHIQENR